MDRLRYLGLRASSRLLRWVRERLTPAGRLALAGLIASAVWGVDTNVSMAYQAFTLLLCLLAAALGLSFMLGWSPMLRRLRLARVLPRFATAEQPFSCRLTVENPGAYPVRGLLLREEPPQARPSWASFHAAADPPDDRFHWVERLAGYSRWRRLLAPERATASLPAVPALAPGGRVSVEVRIVAPRRGRLALSAPSVGLPEPLGLALGWRRLSLEGSMLVLPKRYPVPRLALPGSRRYQQGGVALAAAVGDSQEFLGLRDYRPGDALRRIHWASWAKTGKPVVKEYRDEYFVRHALALDTFVAAGGPAFEEAVSVAASFACSVLTQESLLDLIFVGAEEHCLTAGRGLAGADRLLEALACAQPCPGASFEALATALLRRREGLSGCIAVLLDWDEERRALVRALRGSGVPVLALVVLPEGREAPAEAPDGPARFLQPGRIAEGLAALGSRGG
ncbi:MAG: DUF58 domain-containing protein [Elusimicrobia bacterium]|nr:DUF58 domain-containing protein [Elusimicrobiota bacterium]